MNAKLILAGLILSASTALFAQAPAAPAPADAPKGGPHGKMRPCAQDADPAKCEARRKEMREGMKSAREACKGKEGPERGKCVTQQMCAKSPDPAKCEAHAKERMEHRHERHEKHHKQDKGATPPVPKT